MSWVCLFKIWISIFTKAEKLLQPFPPGFIYGLAGLKPTVSTIFVNNSQHEIDLAKICLDYSLEIGNLRKFPVFLIFVRKIAHLDKDVDKADVSLFLEQGGGNLAQLLHDLLSIGTHFFLFSTGLLGFLGITPIFFCFKASSDARIDNLIHIKKLLVCQTFFLWVLQYYQ